MSNKTNKKIKSSGKYFNDLTKQWTLKQCFTYLNSLGLSKLRELCSEHLENRMFSDCCNENEVKEQMSDWFKKEFKI